MYRHNHSALTGLFLSLGFVVACGHGGSRRAAASASEAHVVMISETYQPADVRAAIGRALASQKFAMEKDDPGNIVATYTKGSRMLKLGIEYTANGVTFHYIQSQGMEANVDANGQPMLDKHYSDLVAKLDGSIKEELGRPARDAAAQARAQSEAAAAAERQARRDQIDAEERQRNYQLALEHEKTRQAHANQAAAEARASMPPAIRVETQTASPGEGYYWTAGHWGWQGGRYSWTPGFWAMSYATVAPPPPQMENPGMPPSDNYFWVRGHHRFVNGQYLWVSGHWDTVRVGYTYIPPFWENQNGRWVHVDGRWISRGGMDVQTTSYRQPAPPPPSPPDCRSVLAETHNDSTQMMFCNGVEPYCAAALLRKGHSPTQLMFCKNVEPQCAVSLINNGGDPTTLMNCRSH